MGISVIVGVKDVAAKEKVRFFCQECGYESAKWLGKCPGCGSWNSFVEELVTTEKEKKPRAAAIARTPAAPLSEIDCTDADRMDTGIGELNRVLGGGLVPGELVLLAGDPGIGKSTLTMQLVGSLRTAGTLMYISGEESAQQIKLRAQRLGVDNKRLLLLTENDLDAVEEEIRRHKPQLIILDSIQTVYLPQVSSAPGSVSQLRECTNKVLGWAKGMGIATILVGHVTKDGGVAGPRVLEHMVDAVLFFEGDRHYQHRVLRALKNRFGSTNEIGIFEMADTGLTEVTNPSEAFLAERPKEAPGSIVVPCMEGTRPLLVELQALVTPAVYGQPRRMTNGTDFNRVSMLMAVLEKRLGLKLGTYDAYVNVVGGLKIDEPAIDLGIAAAIVSSFQNKNVFDDVIVLGEVGLTGELRQVSHLERRLHEAEKMGFQKAVVPRGNALKSYHGSLTVTGVGTVVEALQLILEG